MCVTLAHSTSVPPDHKHHAPPQSPGSTTGLRTLLILICAQCGGIFRVLTIHPLALAEGPLPTLGVSSLTASYTNGQSLVEQAHQFDGILSGFEAALKAVRSQSVPSRWQIDLAMANVSARVLALAVGTQSATLVTGSPPAPQLACSQQYVVHPVRLVVGDGWTRGDGIKISCGSVCVHAGTSNSFLFLRC